MYNAELHLRPRGAQDKSSRIQLSENPHHIFFLSIVPNNKLLYVCSSARQFMIKRHNLSLLFGTWMNVDRDVIYCWDGRGFTGRKHISDHIGESGSATGVCACPAWLTELMVSLSFSLCSYYQDADSLIERWSNEENQESRHRKLDPGLSSNVRRSVQLKVRHRAPAAL